VITKQLPKIKVTQLVLYLTIWVAFLLRVINLTAQSLWRDEIDTILFSSTTFDDLIAHFLYTGHNGPLYFLLMRLWREWVGSSEFAVRYPSALFGTLTIPFSYILARDLGYSRRTGWLFGILLATSPYLVWYGQEAKMYSLLVALIAWAFIAYQRAWQTNRPYWWTVYVIVTSLSFYIHILAPLMLPVYLALAWQQRAQMPWRNWLISLSCLTLPYLPLVAWQIPLLYKGLESGHPFYPLTDQITLLLQIYAQGLLHPPYPFALIIFIFLFLFSLTLPHHRLLLVGWLIIPTILIHFISWRIALFEDRYVIYLTLPYYLLIGHGLTLLRNYSHRVALFCLAAILLSNLTTVWQQQHQPLKTDVRAAVAYLKNSPHVPTTIMVQIPYLQHALRYYYPANNYQLLEGLWTNANQTPTEVNQKMTTLTHCRADIWLVLSEETLWDNRGLMRAWLNDHANLVDSADFTRVSVYYYQFSPKPLPQIYDSAQYHVYLPLIIATPCQPH